MDALDDEVEQHYGQGILMIIMMRTMTTRMTMTMMTMMMAMMMVVVVIVLKMSRTLPQWATGPDLGTGLGEPLDRLVLGRGPVPGPARPGPDCRLPGPSGPSLLGATIGSRAGPRSLPAPTTAVSQRLQPRLVPSSSSSL